MRKIILLAAITLVPLLLSCSRYYSDGDHFFVRNRGADMPVWVKGNADSNVFVLFLHGGPGGDANAFALVGWEFLEKDYRVVYWDQRHAGLSQGNADPEKTTVSMFAEDAELVIDVLYQKYNVGKIFLFGVSWGAGVGGTYLAFGDERTKRSAKTDGFIYAFGNHDMTLTYGFVKPWILQEAQKKIDSGEEVEYWEGCKKFFEERDGLSSASDGAKHFECVIKAGGSESPFESNRPPPEIDIVAFTFLSPAAFLPLTFNQLSTNSSESFGKEVYSDNSLSLVLNNITIPTIIIQGRYDHRAPWEVGQFVFDNISTPVNQKQFIILEKTGHMDYGEDDHDKFENAISSFISSN